MKKESNLSLILTSILSLILGIVLIVATEELLVSINYVLVCLFAIIGVIQIISFLTSREYRNNNYSSLILGTIFIWLSLFIYVYYTMLIIILPVIFSLYAFIMGVVLLIKFFSRKEKRYLILSICSFIIGLVLIFRPELSIYTYFKITGIYVILVSFLYFTEFLKEQKNKE